MNDQLQEALLELKEAGAIDLPDWKQIDIAEDGMEWNGEKANGGPWKLIKNKADSYNCEC